MQKNVKEIQKNKKKSIKIEETLKKRTKTEISVTFSP